jgi:hypothetical protein
VRDGDGAATPALDASTRSHARKNALTVYDLPREDLSVLQLDSFGIGFDDELTALISRVLIETDDDWLVAFDELSDRIRQRNDFASIDHEMVRQWTLGRCHPGAVLALAAGIGMSGYYAAWFLIDSGVFDAATFYLLARSLSSDGPANREGGEVWFSWAVGKRAWSLLTSAALQAPEAPQRPHFLDIARAAETPTQRFEDIEERYDYGVMITPWNHFHLCWLAVRHDSLAAARSHWTALCNAARTDSRVGRFLNRLALWAVFDVLRSDPGAQRELDDARDTQGLEPVELFAQKSNRLSKLWARISGSHPDV